GVPHLVAVDDHLVPLDHAALVVDGQWRELLLEFLRVELPSTILCEGECRDEKQSDGKRAEHGDHLESAVRLDRRKAARWSSRGPGLSTLCPTRPSSRCVESIVLRIEHGEKV